MLLIITAIPALGLTQVNKNQNNITLASDKPDQQSTTITSAKAIGGSDEELAQSFKPQLPTLTRVILRFKSTGSPEYEYYYVYIKQEYNSGTSLRSAHINSDTLVTGTNTVEFDFPDISVTPGNLYYIVVRGVTPSGYSSSVYWWYGSPNPYPDGDAWYEHPASGWNYLQDGPVKCDYCFTTYGMENQPPNRPSCSYDSINDELVVTATDPDNDQIRYGVDWDKDEPIAIDQWTGLVSSGTEQRINCGGRTGAVYVIAEDEHGAQSSPATVKPKPKHYISRPLLELLHKNLRFLEILKTILLDI